MQAHATGSTLMLSSSDDDVTVMVSLHPTSGYTLGTPGPDTCARYTDIVEGALTSEYRQIALRGRVADGCFTEGPIQSSLHGVASAGSAGFVAVRVAFATAPLDTVPALGTDILRTLEIRYPSATATPEWNTVIAPEATEAGRSDCPSEWVAYRDPMDRFSICYPSSFAATASTDALNASSGEIDGISVVVSWDPRPYSIYHPPSEENCQYYTVMGNVSTEFVVLTIGAEETPVCYGVGRLENGVPLGSLQGAIALAEDGSDSEGYVRFSLGFTSETDLAAQRGAAEQLLETLRVPAR
jgi:hypothetical protein